MDLNKAANGAPVRSTGSCKARHWIENVLNKVADEVAKGKDGDASVWLWRIASYRAIVKHDTGTTEFTTRDRPVKYSWPGKSSDEAWRFGEGYS